MDEQGIEGVGRPAAELPEDDSGSPPATTCRFPGCQRVLPKPAGRGRPALYCGQRDGEGPLHSRQSALAAIRREQDAAAAVLRRAGIEASSPDADSDQIRVDYARASAGVLIQQLQRAMTEQMTTAEQILQRLSTATDPAAVEAQLQARSTAAQAEIATARAAAAAAEQRAQTAELQATAAAAVAESAENAATDAEAARAAAAAEASSADARAAQAIRDVETAQRELAEQIEATAQAVHQAETAEAAAMRLEQDLAAVTADRGNLASQLRDAQTTLTEVRATAAAREMAASERITRLDTDLTAARVQIDQLHNDVRSADAMAARETARADRADAEGARLAEDLAAARAEGSALRAELAQARADATRADADLSAARVQIDQLRADLATAREEASAAVVRAATAVAQLEVAREQPQHRGGRQGGE
jgi:colicin import membrane protein